MPDLIGSQSGSLRDAFGKALVDLAADHDFVVFDADVAGGTGVHHFRAAYPQRYFNCGIAEQNMMAMAAGYSAAANVPVFVTTFAVFACRAWEQARLTIAHDRANVKIVCSHPGLDVGPDGASAQCLEDIALFRVLPNMTVIVPADAEETRTATRAILEYDGPVYMRTGRSPAPNVYVNADPFVIGEAEVHYVTKPIVRVVTDLAIIACGIQVARALEAAEILEKDDITTTVVNMSTIKPLDTATLRSIMNFTKAMIVTEDHSIIGGLGSAVCEALMQMKLRKSYRVLRVGVNDTFGQSGEPQELAQLYGIDAKSIAEKARMLLKEV